MKYSDLNIMSTLQSLATWLIFNKFATHYVTSICFLKYASTGLILYLTAKQQVTNALMNLYLTETDIIALQECISVTIDPTSNNKRNPDVIRKEPDTQHNTIVFSAFDLSTKRVGFGNGNT